ncbi:hypothetical protein PV08_07887 [Exophiala spinifera]|uniref:Major facilitator superfamily (MFS) profile domain-containing protein n=1 Tax=Exophiala spinifera TaxID=91928 RepID=A0A0D2B8W9_9EURO|nr:uncharacterized protein PV08_07887 [Exophiala spinifera]KIW15100.1 hypothetical protein PV08_07887 [Exophiala spinifera]
MTGSTNGGGNGQPSTPHQGRSRSEPADEKGGKPRNIKIVDWDGPDDKMNPKNMRSGQKWLIVATLATGSACVTATSSIYTTTYEKMDAEFGNSQIVATLGLTLFVVGLGLSPMFLGPLSEFYGRRPIYISAFALFTIWLVPCAVAQNIQTILIARFFNGLSGAAFLSVAGGSIGDLFKKEELQAPMTIYSASPFTGPCLGPIIGGFINYNTSWRWTYYTLLIWAGVVTILIVLLVPETYEPVILRHKARKKRSETGDESWRARIEIMHRSVARTILGSLLRPFMLLFLDPMCFCLCLFSAILLGVLYLFFGAFALVFQDVYGFNLWQVGLSFLGILVGMLLAVGTLPLWHHLYLYQVAEHQRKTGQRGSMPEFRLPSSVVGSWFCVIGLFWFGWTIYPSIHWIVPIIGTSFFGFGVILSYVGIFTFLVDAFPLYAASALCANSFARSCFAGSFPLFGIQMYRKLNYHWATTLLAMLTLVTAPATGVFYLYGPRLRAKSRFGEHR